MKIGIIGGSGIYKMDAISTAEEFRMDTPFGKPSAPILKATLDNTELFFIPRHGKEHSLLPHEINYRANIYALKDLGVHFIISISAVGSLKEEYPPGSFVLPDQFIDWTRGRRERTFFGNGIIAHVSNANPVDEYLQKKIFESARENNLPCHKGGIYLCIEGPQFSSKAESHLFRSLGGDVIGMTNIPEAYLAKEANISYASLAMVTDYDCWKDKPACVEDILGIMKGSALKAQLILRQSFPKIKEKPSHKDNYAALMTPMEKLSSHQKEIVSTLLS